MLSTVQYQILHVANGIIYRPILLYWLVVRSPYEQYGSSAELLSCLEGYKNGDYFCCVIPIKESLQDVAVNNTGAINISLLLVLDIKFRASKTHPEFKLAIMHFTYSAIATSALV